MAVSMFGRVALGLLLAGCGTQPVRVLIDDEARSPEVRTMTPEVAEACELLGIECESVDEYYGAIAIIVIDANVHGIAGRTFKKHGCRRYAWADNEVKYIAHEMGHMLGLSHSDDPANLMYPSPGTELTDEQLDTVQQHANVLAACR